MSNTTYTFTRRVPLTSQHLLGAVAALVNSERSKVYVHDTDGGVRAATIVAAYLFWLKGLALDDAVHMVDSVCVGANVDAEVIRNATQELLGGDMTPGVLDDTQQQTVVQALCSA